MSEKFPASDNELEIEEFEEDSSDIESADDAEGQALAQHRAAANDHPRRSATR